MPRLDDHGLEDEEHRLLEEGRQKVKSLWEGFIDFALQGNILEIAFGLMYASCAFHHSVIPANMHLPAWHQSLRPWYPPS